jgi:hypothetical protein
MRRAHARSGLEEAEDAAATVVAVEVEAVADAAAAAAAAVTAAIDTSAKHAERRSLSCFSHYSSFLPSAQTQAGGGLLTHQAFFISFIPELIWRARSRPHPELCNRRSPGRR